MIAPLHINALVLVALGAGWRQRLLWVFKQGSKQKEVWTLSIIPGHH